MLTKDEVLTIYNAKQDQVLLVAAELGIPRSTASDIWAGKLYVNVTKHGDPHGLYHGSKRPGESCDVSPLRASVESPISEREFNKNVT